MIKFLDLNGQYQKIKKGIDGAIADVIHHSAFIGGHYTALFEKEFATYQQAEHCIGVANGTDAIEIVLEALDIPKGTEVIVPANSFIATSETVTRQGYRVVFADVDPISYTLDPVDVRRRITQKTSAIIAVHLYGHPCRMDDLLKICVEFDLKLIEDCAQAHGAEYYGKRVGTFGAAGTFSFYPGKNLGAYGDAGAIVTNHQDIANKCRMIANHGRIDKYDHQFEGRNSRLDGLQAAILSVKLPHLDDWIKQRNLIASTYNQRLSGIKQLSLPSTNLHCYHAFHLYVIRTENRDELAQFLNKRDIQTGVHYPIALPKLAAYDYLGQGQEPMFANLTDSTLLSLPIGDHLSIDDAIEVSTAIEIYFTTR
ncbi:DegT/DnrJ/EryC1/StrS family aminotransferase [Chromobacterium piscinae]|uniref:DegT/DnrJ/EryC1/StrS family aminotransferase n=1 Tax=Chromobacterium piscinae TaxID=686831 RepID=A0ABV0H096_9NEIS